MLPRGNLDKAVVDTHVNGEEAPWHRVDEKLCISLSLCPPLCLCEDRSTPASYYIWKCLDVF